jgi:hypothetical protein
MSRPPISSINQLFSVLAGTYGAEWQRQLEAAPRGDVKTAWMFQLERFSGATHRIEWALNNLPDRCPNPVQFRNLCQLAPAPDVPALPEPKADPARVAAELAKLAALRAAAPDGAHGMKAWAHRLQAQHAAGKGLNPNQIRCFTAALGVAA